MPPSPHTPPMSAETAHIPIGAELRAERERRGLALSDVAEELHVRSAYLSAIERGERPNTPDVLPGVGYVLGYVRAYAEEVGLDGDRAVDRYKADMAIPENLRLRDAPHIVTKRRRKLPRGIVPAVLVLATAIAFAAYYAIQPSLDGNVEEAPVMVAGGAEEITPDTWVLRAETASWIRVRASDGTEMFNAIMVPGQVVTFPPESAPIVDVRDAGAVRLGRGGRDLGPLGPRGRARDNLVLGDTLTVSPDAG